MLRAIERILRELPSSLERARVETRGAVKPPVLWRDTFTRRSQTQDRSLFVSAPTQRRYDTPLARLLKLALAQYSSAVELADVGAARGIGDLVADRRNAATRMLHHAKLRDVRSMQAIPAHALKGVLRHRHADSVVAFVELFRDAVDEQSLASIKEVVSQRLLVPWQPDKLFELFVGFQLIEGFRAAGYREVERRLFPQHMLPFARLQRLGETITVWYQRGLPLVAGGEVFDGEYARALQAAGLSRSSLQPDFIVTREPGREILLVEVKFTAREDESPDRVGIKDALMYLHDGRSVLESKARPRALVAAWNSKAHPNSGADVMVCAQGTVGQAAAAVLGAWDGSVTA